MNDTINEIAARRFERAQNGYEARAIFATLADNETVRVSDPKSYDAALAEWTKLDELHRKGLLPRVKFFEVRTVFVGPDRPLVGPVITSHDRYDGAKIDLSVVREVTNSRGFASAKAAARAAWRLYFPEFTDRQRGHQYFQGREYPKSTDQGRGGWFYYPNGSTAAQGLDDLARVAKAKHLISQGLNGRWYVYNPEVL